MKIFTAFAIAQLFLLATGTDFKGESKRVGCLYRGLTWVDRILFPKDIDPTICTHLIYTYGTINEETDEIEIKTDIPSLSPDQDAEGIGPKLRRLKDANPDLKLILQTVRPPLPWVLTNSSRKANVIRNSVQWLKQSGFDGLDFPSLRSPPDTEIADFFCDLKAELDKYGYILETTILDIFLPGPSQQQKDAFTKMASCCEEIILLSSSVKPDDHRYAGINYTRTIVDKFVESGVPANKIHITVSAVASIFLIASPNETERVVNITGPDNGTFNLKGEGAVYYKDLLERMNDSSLGWTFRREETKEPYAFTETGLWIAYEDVTSMEYKAQYVMERGLGGINIHGLDQEDAEGVGGDGRFPFTRAIYNTFRKGNQSSFIPHC